MNDFEEEKGASGIKAWRGYVDAFQQNSFFSFRHDSRQRQVHCKKCRCLVPKEIPRLRLTGSWSYYTGFYCLKCASSVLLSFINEREELVRYLESNVRDLKKIVEVAQKCREKPKYKEVMDVVEMMAKLNPQR